jgi:hypothetical protein
MAGFCHGEFSEETKRLLQAEHAGRSVVTSLALCETCGLRVKAENKFGQWMPVNHRAPRPYNSRKRINK